MKNIRFLLLNLLLASVLFSCNKKKLIEVVEVPLPSAQEKVTMGMPDDVRAEEGSFQLEIGRAHV